MKRCPKCSRVEKNDTLVYCKDDGTRLVGEPSAGAGEAGTAQLGASPDASEVHTSILPHSTQANVNRVTGPTTALPEPVSGNTQQFAKPKRRKTIVVVAIVAAGVLGLALVVVVASTLVYFNFKKPAAPAITSIAVMPFVNEGGNADVEYLSDGMTETLIKSLSELPNLNVKPRSSVFRYKGKDTDVKTIGKELNVEAILNGRVIQRGEQLTLSLELIDIQNDKVLWTERYQRKQSDLVSLQSEIARDVSNKLKLKLSGADEAKVTKPSTANPEAYQAYLKGRYYWNRRTAQNLRKAIEEFKTATDRDPNYALAFVGLADSYSLLNEYAGVPTSESIPQARNYAERALLLDPQLAEVHASLAYVNGQSWQWAEAEREYKESIRLNPNYATAYQWYGTLLRQFGRFDEAVAMFKRANELDPLSRVISTNIAQTYQIQSNTEASIEQSRKTIELDPNFGAAYSQLGLSYSKIGRNADAISAAERAAELTTRANDSLGYLGYVYGVTGKRTQAAEIIRELEGKYARKEANGLDVAAVYAGLGEKDKAFEWLEKDFKARTGKLGVVRWMVPYEPLRDDPRFRDLLKRIGLPE